MFIFVFYVLIGASKQQFPVPLLILTASLFYLMQKTHIAMLRRYQITL